MANQGQLYIIVLLHWGSRTRILALFRRRTIPGFSSDAAQASGGGTTSKYEGEGESGLVGM